MIPFVVQIIDRPDIFPAENEQGQPQGRWVLAVDAAEDTFLVESNGGFRWVSSQCCKLMFAATPENMMKVAAAAKPPPIHLPGNGRRL